MWSPVQRFLQDLGPVWAPDLPGFGTEPPVSPRSRTLEAYADWVAERMPDGAARVAGYSMGGTLALLLALRHPGRVGRLALCCSSPCWGLGWRGWAARWFAAAGRAAAEVFLASVRLGLRRWVRDPAERAVVDDMAARAHRPTLLALHRALAATDLRSRLPGVDAPVLVIGGARDWLAPPSHLDRLARELPQAERVSVPGTGHLLSAQQPDTFGAALRTFFSLRPPAEEVL